MTSTFSETENHGAYDRDSIVDTDSLTLHVIDDGIEVYDEGEFIGTLTNEGIRNAAERPTHDIHAKHYVEYNGTMWNCKEEGERTPFSTMDKDPRESGECPFCGTELQQVNDD